MSEKRVEWVKIKEDEKWEIIKFFFNEKDITLTSNKIRVLSNDYSYGNYELKKWIKYCEERELYYHIYNGLFVISIRSKKVMRDEYIDERMEDEV